MYTKGEWEVYKLPEKQYPDGVTSYGLKWAIEADKKGICYISDKWISSPKGAEMEANAHLIASAPDLYEACKQALKTFEAHRIEPSDSRYIRLAIALAKVENRDG